MRFAALRRDLDGPHDGDLHVPLLRAARAPIVAALVPLLDRPVVLIAAKPNRAQALHDSLRAFGLPADRLFRFPEPSALFYERAPWPREVAAERLNVLSTLATLDTSPVTDNQLPVIVSSVRALMYRTLPPRAFKLGTRTLRRGQSISLNQLLEVWVGFGYESTTTVLAPGEFSRRGGIVDVYPPALPRPVRIEFFGDEVESLRAFDPATQRSLDTLDQISITPAAECLAKNGPLVAEHTKAWDTSNLPDDQATQFEKDRLALIAGTPFRGIEFYLPLLHGDATTLIDYVPRNALIVLDDAEEIEDAWSELEEQALDLRHSAEEAGTLPPNFPLPYVTWDEWHEKLSHRSTLSLNDSMETLDRPPAEQLPLSPGPRFGGQLKTFIEHLAQLRGLNDATVVVSRQASHWPG